MICFIQASFSILFSWDTKKHSNWPLSYTHLTTGAFLESSCSAAQEVWSPASVPEDRFVMGGIPPHDSRLCFFF